MGGSVSRSVGRSVGWLIVVWMNDALTSEKARDEPFI